MNRHYPDSGPQAGMNAVEGRLAMRIAGLLSDHVDALPHDIHERLRVARLRALERVRQPQPQLALTFALALGISAGGSMQPPSVWIRLASAFPLIVLVCGLAFIQQYHSREQISAAAEIDSALLSDELPPSAYGDPGFSAFLRDVEVR